MRGNPGRLARLVAALGAALLGVGCGSRPAPTEADARRVVEPHLWKCGEPLAFEKRSGTPVTQTGTTVYVLHFRAAVKLTEACYWERMAMPLMIEGQLIESHLQRREELSPRQQQLVDEGGPLPPDLIPLPAGALYVLNGKVLYKPAEKGWAYDSWYAIRRGYCLDRGPAECYEEHRID